jgi:acyl-CoA synthetase (AMP-forming)/AMP-acid ligase II
MVEDRFVRAAPVALAPLGSGFHVAAHVLGHARVVCDARVLEILEWHRRPRTPAQVAKHFGESERGVAFVLKHLVQAQLLVSTTLDPGERIRRAFKSRRANLPKVAPSLPLAAPGGLKKWIPDNWQAREATAFALSEGSCLVLSPCVVSLGVRPGETIALHPLGPRVHLRDRVWQLARAFQRPSTIAAVAKRLGVGSVEELVAACRFLVLRRLLWPSAAAERRTFEALGAELDLGPDAPSVRQWSDPPDQWTDVATPYDWADVSRLEAFGRVALVGQCQINFVGAALQRLAQRHHVYLALHGEATPSDGLSRAGWSAVFVSLAEHGAELHEAAARGEWERARDAVPGIVAAADDIVAAVRRRTGAPVAVVSVAPPALSPFDETSPHRHTRAGVYAELNARLAAALAATSDAFLLDESALLGAERDRVTLDDEYTGAAHHCAFDPRFWMELTQWAGPSFAPTPPFPASASQSGASGAIAVGLFDFLRRRYEPVPVRVVVFDPDTWLWPGTIADKPAAHDSLQRSLGRPDYQFYCGVNEALLAVRARGVKLVCLSPLPEGELREKWNVPGHSTTFVSAEHVDGVVRDACGLEDLLGRLGVSSRECLALGVGRRWAAAESGARVFRGDRWSLKRYLLTAPELTSTTGVSPHRHDAIDSRDADSATVREAGGRGRLSEADVASAVDQAIARHLPALATHRADDLRLLGLDSLTALDLAHDIEASLGVVLADKDLTIASIFRRSTLLEATYRASEAKAGRAPAAFRSARGRASPSSDASDRVVDRIYRHAERGDHPWQIKMVRSSKPNDYEYAGWGALLERAYGYADLFADLGARAGDVVTLMLPQGIPLVAAFVAAVLHDFVPSIVAAPSEKLSEAAFAAWFGEVAARSGTRLVLCDPSHEALVRASVAASSAPSIVVSSVRPLPAARARVASGRAPNRPLLLQHSSGTTGLKKAVLLNEPSVAAQIRHLARALRCDARDVVVSWAPLYHDMGLMACLLLPLLTDLPVVMMSPFDWLASPDLLLREVTRERGTLSWMPNFAFLYTAQRVPEEAMRGIDLSSWRAVVNCSEPVTERAADAFHRRFGRVGLRRSALSASFAMAETSFAVTQVPPGRGLVSTAVDATLWHKQGIARPIGREAGAPQGSVVLTGSGELIGGTELEVVDPNGRAVPEGHAGEIRVRCESLMDGYFGDPEATAGAVRQGWYFTGDVGVMLGREVYVTGRKKDLVIVAGHNVYPHDVEESLGDVRGIKPGRVVAVGVPDDALGTERLVILAETVVEHQATAGELEELAQRVRAHVSSVFGVAVHDVRIYAERTLLKSTSGKLSRARNRALYLERLAAPLLLTVRAGRASTS